MKKIWQAWSQFWFSPVSLVNLAVMRVILAGTLFFLYLSRWPDWKIFYSEEGILPRALALKIYPEFLRPYFEWYFWPDAWSGVMHGLLVLSLFCVAVGLGGRIICFLSWVLFIAFFQRNYAVVFGADVIGGTFLLYLSLTQASARYSLDSLWFKRKAVSSDMLTSVFYRMIQIQLCVIYAYTGMEKLKGASWWDGTALWTVFANPQMVVFDLTWMRHLPLVLVGLAFSTIFFEIYFPVLVWSKKLRNWVLGAGLCFHFGICFVMALYSFGLVMITPYVLFLGERETLSILEFLKAKVLRLRRA